jgi:hypothetical protein
MIKTPQNTSAGKEKEKVLENRNKIQEIITVLNGEGTMNKDLVYRKVKVGSDCEPFWIGYFHCWAGTSEIPFALVETPSGKIERVNFESIKFEDLK